MNISFLNHLREFEIEYFFKKLKPVPGKKILDFGAGDGFALNKFEKYGLECFGVDLENSNYDDRTGRISLYDGNIENFPLKKNLDIIYSSNVLEHVEDIKLMLEFFNEKLEENGIQVHIVPTHFWKFYNALFYYWSVLKYVCKKSLNYIRKEEIVNEELKISYKKEQKKSIRESPLFIGRHGSRGTSFQEFQLFHPKTYRKILNSLDFEYVDFKIPLIYSGHYFLGRLFPIALRSALSRFIGYSCHCFIISKKIN